MNSVWRLRRMAENRVRCYSLRLVHLLIVFFLLLAQADAQNQPDGEEIDASRASELLKLWANTLAGDYAGLKAWEGEYDFIEERSFLPQSKTAESGDGPLLIERREGSGTFAVDVEKGAVFSSLKAGPLNRHYEGSEESTTVNQEFELVAVLDRQQYWHFSPNLRYGRNRPDEVLVSDGQMGRMAFREPAEAAPRGAWGSFIDPREFVKFPAPPGVEWLGNAMAFEKIADGELANDVSGYKYSLTLLEVAEDSKHYLLHIPNWLPDGSVLRKEWLIEVGDAPRIAGIEEKDGSGHVKQSLRASYENVSGIDVPVRLSRTIYNQDGTPRFFREMSIRTTSINEPIPSERFSISVLGLKEGDRLLDKIERIEYTFRNGELEKASGKPVPLQ